MRLGYAIVPDWLSTVYMKVMTPFSVDVLSLAGGIAALGDAKYIKKSIETVKNVERSSQADLNPVQSISFRSKFHYDRRGPRIAQRYVKTAENGNNSPRLHFLQGAGDSLIRISVGTQEQNLR